MKIGELAARTGVSVRALRYYEEKGVLTPGRTPSGYRIFAAADTGKVAHIQTLLAAGLGMDLIGQILSCLSGEALLLDDCRDRLEAERRRITGDIDQLVHTRSLLDDLLATTRAPARQAAIAVDRLPPSRSGARASPSAGGR